MVIAKPIQFTMVSEVPLVLSGAFCATSVENKGESAITTHPQKKRKQSKPATGAFTNISGESKQQEPDKNKQIDAIFFAPNNCERNPLNTQAILPPPIIRKDNNGIDKLIPG